jgi:hypothetical protein
MVHTHRLPPPQERENERIYLTDVTVSVAFEYNGRYVYLIPRSNSDSDAVSAELSHLRQRLILYSKMTEFSLVDDGLFRCTIQDAAGDTRHYHFRSEDVYANLNMVGSVMDTQPLEGLLN